LPAIIIIFIAVIVFLVLNYISSGFSKILSFLKAPHPYENSIILFYQDNCDHCEKVDNFIRDNKVEEKVAFVRLNVYGSPENINILSDKAQTCGLDVKIIGVPFLWDGKNCILGDVEVINFFKTQIAVKK